MNYFTPILLVGVFLTLTAAQSYDETEIHGYHFHTYFWAHRPETRVEAMAFRAGIQAQIDAGPMVGCRLNRVFDGPLGPHPIAQFETCCNASSISAGISFFTKNRGNLTLLLHPLTRWELVDHTERLMFFGDSTRLDPSSLHEDLGEDGRDMCLPLLEEDDGSGGGGSPGGSLSISPIHTFHLIFLILSAKLIANM